MPSDRGEAMKSREGGFHYLIGARIVADDRNFLGIISPREFEADSIMNDLGPHGNAFMPYSIFNDFGKYGGKYSDLSPFNEFASRPPRLFIGDKFVTYLTVSELFSPRVNPMELVAWLKAVK
jgi:hypothetical protein